MEVRRVTMHIELAPENAELAWTFRGVDEVHALEGSDREIVESLRAGRYDTAVALFNKTRVNRLVRKAGIPRRIGPATKLASLALTHRVPQRRSESRKHEADYNLDLLAPLGLGAAEGSFSGIDVPDEALARADAALADRGLGAAPVVALHPGSGGSALPWRTARYAELADHLARDGYGVLVTGGPGEEPLVEKTVARAESSPPTWIGTDGRVALAAMLARVRVLVSSSTGPMHVAAALGTAVVSLFCPRHVCAPRRWGPRSARASVLVPRVDLVCDLCLGPNCPHYDCMDTIPAARVLAEVRRWAAAA